MIAVGAVLLIAFGFSLGVLWNIRWTKQQTDFVFAEWRASSDKIFDAWRDQIIEHRCGR